MSFPALPQGSVPPKSQYATAGVGWVVSTLGANGNGTRSENSFQGGDSPTTKPTMAP